MPKLDRAEQEVEKGTWRWGREEDGRNGRAFENNKPTIVLYMARAEVFLKNLEVGKDQVWHVGKDQLLKNFELGHYSTWSFLNPVKESGHLSTTSTFITS